MRSLLTFDRRQSSQHQPWIIPTDIAIDRVQATRSPYQFGHGKAAVATTGHLDGDGAAVEFHYTRPFPV